MPARLPIDRVFTVKGFGTVVTGTLWSADRSCPTTELILWPAGSARARARTSGAWRARGTRRGRATRGGEPGGRRARARSSADMCCSATGVALSSRRLAVDVEVLPDAPAQKHGTRMHVHLGTSVALGRLILPASGWPRASVRVLAPGAARRGAAPPGVAAAGPAWRSPRAARLLASGDDRLAHACTDPCRRRGRCGLARVTARGCRRRCVAGARA